jgi:hypothetical protein
VLEVVEIMVDVVMKHPLSISSFLKEKYRENASFYVKINIVETMEFLKAL